ncbi:MAG: S41 family peptidase [Flavobacteriales bacterium]|nr:S41 family peptidase [Flavobacteriales bacterium]
MLRSLRNTWKTWAFVGVIAASGVVTLAAKDNFFEISKNLEIFNELFKELNIYYVDDTSPGELMTTAIDAMLESLDPYTQYIAESDMEDYRFQTTGQYGGIGALIRKKGDHVVVSEPYEGYPAMKAGLWAGDEILEVDGRKVKGMDTDEVSKLLKGQSGTSVKLVTQREGQAPLTHTLTREEIKIPDVPYKGIIDEAEQVGYLKLNSFTQTAGQEVRTAVKELKEKGAKKIILDLRGNGGGLLREAVNIVNLFVPRNELVVETKGRIAEWDKAYKTLGEPMDAEIPIVVVVDEHSASASEIVSGALQDLDRAVIVGERTYGKGLVQQTRDLYYNAKLKVTVAKYYIPSGRCIQKIDYAHRDSVGKAVEVDERTIAQFKTRNGRPVTDGRGILPDVEVVEPEMPKVVGGLYAADVIFDYANKFRREHESIPPAKQFVITEEIYQDFMRFAKERSFDYDTESVAKLNELVEVARRERYYEHAKGAIDALKVELTPDRKEDLRLFRADIERVLRYEIVTRYYHQTGRMEAAVGTDPYLLKAIETLSTGTWAGILKGTAKN